MLTPEVRVEGVTTEDWIRFVQLWRPRAATQEKDRDRPRGGVLVVHHEGKLRKVLHTQRGRVETQHAWPAPLALLAAEHHASWGLSIREGALEELMERFGARLRRGDDITVQLLTLAQILRELMADGALELWPHRLKGVPAPTEAMVRRAIDSLCGDGKAICLGMFEEGELYTCFVARRRGVGFDVIAGPCDLRAQMGLLSGDFRRDYRHLVRAVESRYAPLAFGCFAETSTFRSLQTDERPGAWGRAVALRDIVFSPTPAAIGLALSVDGARYAASHLKTITTNLDPFGIVEPMMLALRDKVGRMAGKTDVSSTLGFDPLAALRALLRR